MWLLIMVLMTSSLHEAAESSKQKYWPWIKNVIEPVKEIKQHEVQCLAEGSNGNEYRGTISVTSRGYKCLYWDRTQAIGKLEVSQGLGLHNYCRNPDNRTGPWCWVRGRNQKVRHYCKIPQCETKTNAPNQDTEMTCGERTPEQNFKIIGGSKASIESQPWLASIFKNDVFKCGGTLIASCWVLSAAHCFPLGKRTRKEQYSVYLGKDSTNQTDLRKEQTFEVAELVLHQKFDYKAEDFNNDIDCGQQWTVCTEDIVSEDSMSPPAQHMMPSGTFCHIAGYGYERNDEIPGNFRYSTYMKEAQVQIFSKKHCERKYYGKRVTENQFCAASPKWTEDACQGDSGGPLLCEANRRMFLFGIISWGEGCASKNKPGVYTKVTNYNSWIAKHTDLPSFTTGIMYPRKD